MTIAGHTTGTADRAAGNLSIETNATRTDAACAFETRNGSIITINGNPNIAYHSTFNFVAWKPSGLQTQTHKGSFTWARSTGGSGTCDVDLTSVFDPSTHRYGDRHVLWQNHQRDADAGRLTHERFRRVE